MTDGITDGRNDGQPKANKAPRFQSGAIIKSHNSVTNSREMTDKNPNVDLEIINVYTKFG